MKNLIKKIVQEELGTQSSFKTTIDIPPTKGNLSFTKKFYSKKTSERQQYLAQKDQKEETSQ